MESDHSKSLKLSEQIVGAKQYYIHNQNNSTSITTSTGFQLSAVNQSNQNYFNNSNQTSNSNSISKFNPRFDNYHGLRIIQFFENNLEFPDS